jgi:DNA invertase Pin-like site-specific DNA recombinase
MMAMSKSRGYSHNLVKLIEGADQQSIGVQLGRMCIENDIPVREIATALNVSRMTVYHWFAGRFTPRQEYVTRIEQLLEDRRRSAV